MFSSFCCLDNTHILSVLWSGLVFVFIYHSHSVALADVDIL